MMNWFLALMVPLGCLSGAEYQRRTMKSAENAPCEQLTCARYRRSPAGTFGVVLSRGTARHGAATRIVRIV
jgi:hypothetical protein